MLYKVSIPCSNPVLVRVFGKGGDCVIDRKTENDVFSELSEVGLCPKLLGIFENGRLEEFLQGRRTLEPLEMLQNESPDFMRMVARQLAVFHEFSPKSLGARVSQFWPTIHKYASQAAEVTFPAGSTKAEALAKLDIGRILAEIQILEMLVPSPQNDEGATLIAREHESIQRRAMEFLFSTHFTHMDLLSGNIMYSEVAGDVRFIDFEYADYCYVGMDLANCFCAIPESCLIFSGKFDAERYFPSVKQQRYWLSAYLEGRNVDPDDEFVEALLKQLRVFVLAQELRWTVWAVVQAANSPVDYDYLNYAHMRFYDGYLTYKLWLEEGRPQ